jgi:hypothetical protein
MQACRIFFSRSSQGTSRRSKDIHIQGLISIDFYRHMFFMTEEKEEEVAANVDKFMDSYARDTTVNELKDV